jgi:hypothetical protein
VRKKLSVFDRFNNFMVNIGQSALKATPQDVKVYLTIWSVTNGTYSAGPWNLVAPSSAQALISHLATELDRFPMCGGNWDPAACKGACPAREAYGVPGVTYTL